MSPLAYLTRIDDTRHMARFYRLDIQPTLFGEWALVREWGRIGSSGQLRYDPFPTIAEAEAAHARLECAKGKRGYHSHLVQHCVMSSQPVRPDVATDPLQEVPVRNVADAKTGRRAITK